MDYRTGIDAVAFDLDGTLVDSRLDFTAMRRELGFPEGIGLIEHMETLGDAAAVERAWAVIERHEMAGAEAATWIPGARELLAGLHSAGVPTAILTRNARITTEHMHRALDIPVDLVLTREDCQPKPDPDGLHRIAAQLGVPTARMIYVGDFVYDLQTARAAGAHACLLRNERNGRFALEADLIVDHLDELALHLGATRSAG
ncbi:N-acetylmuramic acid 6-phosphate phosphatase [wastewater metagenome]|uniref:N-acetylmuramic acid 6-phosphate phosphatase n=2 Tax=unclassified sequences TaxID=12908 RepID=A0A5B8REW0_9ZZZZ|nr:HAD family hydrolase [Arhodomonas sp. KWT]QEA05375.1 N-acetylmuramic acid 6-phosphate phosphatase [uncultured organism]